MVSRRQLSVFVVCLAVSILSLYQTFRYLFSVPEGYVYPLVHNFEQDYYWYLSLMRQGWEGKLLLTSRYTPEIFAPQPVNTFFALLGIISRFTGLNLPVVYTVSRVLGGAVLIYASYLLIRRLPGSSAFRYLSFLFVVLGTPLWFLKNGTLTQAGEFWTGFDPVLRVTWLPHHTLSNALYLLVFLLVVGGAGTKSVTILHLAGIFAVSFAAVWLNPATGMLLGFVCLGTLGVEVFRKPSVLSAAGFRSAWPYLSAVAGSGIALMTLFAIQNTVFPWTAFADWERFNRYPISGLGYLSVLGISGIFAVPGLFFALKKYRPAWTGIVLWYLFPFAGLMLPSDFLPVSNGRFLQSAGYIPAAILGALAVTESVIRLKTGKAIAIAAVTVVFVALSLPSFAASIRRQEYYIARNASNPEVYVPQTTMEGLQKLSEGAGGILVAPRDVSVLAPAFTSYRVVSGHPTFTFRQGEKERVLSAFYAVDDAFREDFLGKYPADAIWLPEGQTNMSWLDGMGYAKVYGNSVLTVYEKK